MLDFKAFAEDTMRQTFDRAVRRSELTHWQHPDYGSYGCCGTMTSRFSSAPTCEKCQQQLAIWEAENEETRKALGVETLPPVSTRDTTKKGDGTSHVVPGALSRVEH